MRALLVAVLLAAIYGLAAPCANAQFAIGVGGLLSDQGHAIAVDASGSIYITGWFTGTVDFDPGPGVKELTAAGTEFTFVASYDATGALRYAVPIGGNNGGVHQGGLAVDNLGNVYVTGAFFGSAIDFDPGTDERILNAQDGRIFVASYDPSGGLRWAFNVGGGISNLVEAGTGIALDGAANVYVTGIFNGEEDFDPDQQETPFVSNGPTDAFVASYTSSSGYRFAFPIGGASADLGLGIAADASGNSYVTGGFRGMADFDPTAGEVVVTSEGGEDIYFASYNPNGLVRFAIGVGSMGSGATDRGQAVAVDASGNAFITGHFGDGAATADFDPGAGEARLMSNGSADLFLASYDPSGAHRFAFGLGTANQEQGNDVAIDGAGNAHLTGILTGSMDFDPGPGMQVIGENGIKAFVASYTNTGLYRLAGVFEPTSTSSSVGYGIALDGSGQAHVIGGFNGTVDFDPGAGTVDLMSNGSSDVFVSNYGATLVAAEPTPYNSKSLSLSPAIPNPSTAQVRLKLSVNRTQPIRAEVYDALGRCVAVLFEGVLAAGTSRTLELAGGTLPSGLYVIRVQGADGAVRQPVVLSR